MSPVLNEVQFLSVEREVNEVQTSWQRGSKIISLMNGNQWEQQQSSTKIITASLANKELKIDKNGNPFLTLHLTSGEIVYCFDSLIKMERWDDLKEGKIFNWTVRESEPLPSFDKGLLRLLNFEEEKFGG